MAGKVNEHTRCMHSLFVKYIFSGVWSVSVCGLGQHIIRTSWHTRPFCAPKTLQQPVEKYAENFALPLISAHHLCIACVMCEGTKFYLECVCSKVHVSVCIGWMAVNKFIQSGKRIRHTQTHAAPHWDKGNANLVGRLARGPIQPKLFPLFREFHMQNQ